MLLASRKKEIKKERKKERSSLIVCFVIKSFQLSAHRTAGKKQRW